MGKDISKIDAVYAQYAIDCAERVLPLFDSDLARSTIAAARSILSGKRVGFDRMLLCGTVNAYNKAAKHNRNLMVAHEVLAACLAALNATYAASGIERVETSAKKLADRAARCAKLAIMSQRAYVTADALIAYDSEAAWQASRLRELLEAAK